MFQIGDNIVYPMHGAGIIKSIKQVEILGEKQPYFVIQMQISNMEIMIPMSKILSSNIRPVSDIHALTTIINVFQDGESGALLPWRQRYKVNSDKIKTGELKAGVEVVRDLMRMKKEKILNASEKKMLEEAHGFLNSELELIKGITENQMNSFAMVH